MTSFGRPAIFGPCLLLTWLLCGCEARVSGSDMENAGQESLRIVSLAPNLTELVYAAGAGDQLVGVSEYSNYPQAAAALPRIGDAFRVDLEQLALLKPDLLLSWASGTPQHTVDELRQLGYRIEPVRTESLEDVGKALVYIGQLVGKEEVAARQARSLRAGLESMRSRYAQRAAIRVFYQISERPLYTVSGRHYISELITLCGGENIFADLEHLAPSVDPEAVIDKRPEVILAAGSDAKQLALAWANWPQMAANRYANTFVIDADLIGRATPRLLEGGQRICDALEAGRRNRSEWLERPDESTM